MPKSYSSREIIRMLEENGFSLRSVKGSHHKYVSATRKVIVPHLKKGLRLGTLMSVLKMAGLGIEDLE